MTPCPTYLTPPGYQLGAGPTGPVDCTAWAASRAIAHATCGAMATSLLVLPFLARQITFLASWS